MIAHHVCRLGTLQPQLAHRAVKDKLGRMPDCVAADWLEDHCVETADVCLLYARSLLMTDALAVWDERHRGGNHAAWLRALRVVEGGPHDQMGIRTGGDQHGVGSLKTFVDDNRTAQAEFRRTALRAFANVTRRAACFTNPAGTFTGYGEPDLPHLALLAGEAQHAYAEWQDVLGLPPRARATHTLATLHAVAFVNFADHLPPREAWAEFAKPITTVTRLPFNNGMEYVGCACRMRQDMVYMNNDPPIIQPGIWPTVPMRTWHVFRGPYEYRTGQCPACRTVFWYKQPNHRDANPRHRAAPRTISY